MTTDNPIADLLASPLGADWTVEGLAESLLGAIAAMPAEEPREVVFDADATDDRQSRRLFRPLLACLANRSAAEAGMPPNLYQGNLSFNRPGPQGPVWILGRFENRPGAVRLALRRSSSPPERVEGTAQHPVTPAAGPSMTAPAPVDKCIRAG